MREYHLLPFGGWILLMELTICIDRGVILAACLKARGVESVVVEKNPRPGDNWALRYDCLRFHIGKHSCNPPFYRMFPLSSHHRESLIPLED